MNKLWLLALGFWLLALGSCSSHKSMSSLRNLSANHIIREVEKNQFEFDNLEAKFNVKLKGDNNIGLKGQLRMQNDSVIWISVSLKLGVEVARVMITEDSVMFINRTNKTYLSEDINNLQQRLPCEVTMNFVQNLLVGNDMLFNEKYKVIIDDDSYKLESKEYALKRDIWVIPKIFKVKRIWIQSSTADSRQPTVMINYDNFQNINGKFLPTRIILDTDDKIGLDIEIDYSEIKVGEKLEFPFNISKKYSRI